MPFLRRRGNAASEVNMRQHVEESVDEALKPSSESPLSSGEQDRSIQPRGHMSEDSAHGRPNTPPIQEQTNKHKRFSVLRFRNASDSQLSLRARQQGERVPPVPLPPAIITTAPTNELNDNKLLSPRLEFSGRFRRNKERRDTLEIGGHATSGQVSTGDEKTIGPTSEPRASNAVQLPLTTSSSSGLEPTRQSESSKSDRSSVDAVGQTSPVPPGKKTPASSIFRLRRPKATAESLFPLAHLPQQGKLEPSSTSQSLASRDITRPASARSIGAPRLNLDTEIQSSPVSGTFPVTVGRSVNSSPTRVAALRGRSSTMSSLGRDSTDDHLAPPTTRTSISTGRKSFGDLLGLSRLRQNSELSRQGTLTPATPGSIGSKNNSLQLVRDSFVLPERQDEESAAKYLARLEDMAGMGAIAASLSKSSDQFFLTVLRSYMRKFSFFGDPMDMALRKLLMEAELPRETQQIDRFLQAFANRYHECNPGIFLSPDQAYFIAFSLLILHTDVYNKNNKYKMQKADYIKNTKGEGVMDDVLECFYDNISYTPFIHVEDDLETSAERLASKKPKRKPLLPGATNSEIARRAAKEPIDPYTLILEGNLDILRPNLKEAMYLEDHFNYLGTSSSLNMNDLQKTFFRTGVLQIVSPRSRPDAFMSEKTATNPQQADPGIVDIKVTKVGMLWRKDIKKRKTRSPWQEWGAILTGAQLYFFRNTSWIKNLMHQYDSHVKAGHDGIPLIFNPPLEQFKPDALISTEGAVALMDTTYKKHKNAFVYVHQASLHEVLLADTEDELNDWMAKLNYAAAFRTSGVRMRGLVGGSYDGQGRRGLRRLDSSDVSQLIQTPSGPVTITRSKIDHKMAEDIQLARREIMREKIREADEKVDEAQRRLDEQLRNARHLQILAPVQPRTREYLLSAAARMSAQLKWTRMEIWREKCHRDILYQDLFDDTPADPAITSPEQKPANTITTSPKRNKTETSSASTPCQSPVERRPPSSAENIVKSPKMSMASDSECDSCVEAQPPCKDEISVKQTRPIDRDNLSEGDQPGEIAETGRDARKPAAAASALDEEDAEERQLLRQAGLLDTHLDESPIDRLVSTGESSQHALNQDGEKMERSKVRRSLHRTLRESAGHLSHHRSKRGRDSSALLPEDGAKETTLTRGTGSFVVHGKKASVINLETELSNMSKDEKILYWKQQQQQASVAPSSPNLSIGGDDGFSMPPELPSESSESKRRESQASASTATAMSFRELHRKYSSAQAARSVSSGARLTAPSDGESDIAASLSGDYQSPFQPPYTGSAASAAASDPETDDDTGSSGLTESRRGANGGDGGSSDESEDELSTGSEEERDTGLPQLANATLQPVQV